MQKVAVLGLGLIGGSVLRSASSQYEMVGWDISPGTRHKAQEECYTVADNLEEAVQGAWITIVATPPSVCAEIVLQALAADNKTIVLDTASIKQDIVDEVTNNVLASRYLPAHPLAGGVAGGWESSSLNVLDKAPWAVCPHPFSSNETLYNGVRFISSLEDSVVACEASEHDRVVAYASHAVRLTAAALAQYGPSDLRPLIEALHGGGLGHATRMAASNPSLWQDIICHNEEATKEALDELIALLSEARDNLDEPEKLTKFMNQGNESKERMEEKRWRGSNWKREVWPFNEMKGRLLAAGTQGQAVQIEGRTLSDVFVLVRK